MPSIAVHGLLLPAALSALLALPLAGQAFQVCLALAVLRVSAGPVWAELAFPQHPLPRSALSGSARVSVCEVSFCVPEIGLVS